VRLKDFLGREFQVEDTVAVSTSRGIRVGQVQSIESYNGYTSVTLFAEAGIVPTNPRKKRHTFEYESEKFYLTRPWEA